MKTRLIALLFTFPFLTTFAGAQDQTKPNVVVMMVDNLGWGELGCYGGGELRGRQLLAWTSSRERA